MTPKYSGGLDKWLTEKARQQGATTVFSVQQVGEGMATLGRMGSNPAEIGKSSLKIEAIAT